jgi:site-specific DNA recombinase
MQVAIYAWVSKSYQDESLEHQIERLRTHAEAQGWSLMSDDVFRDDGYTGASLRRPGLEHLRDRAAAATLDRIEPPRVFRRPVWLSHAAMATSSV